MADEKEVKKVIRRWTPELLALYLLNKDPMYAIPVFRGAEIREAFPEICGNKGGQLSIRKIEELMAAPEFDATVKRELTDNIKNKDTLVSMFFALVAKVWRANMALSNPGTKMLDVLGYMTGEYDPRVKSAKPPGMTTKQKAQLEHYRNEAEANRKLREKQTGDSGGGTDGGK